MTYVLVCGLGNLGQHCVLELKKFGAIAIAIERVLPPSWEIPILPQLLDDLIVGDCRQNEVLERAKIRQCQAALIVTSNEGVNIETALAIRQLNPHARLVVRSAKAKLNRLLSSQLGNFIAYEPTELPAKAFGLAALGSETLGFFNLDGRWLKVTQRQMERGHEWSYTRLLYELNTRRRRLLSHSQLGIPLPQSFHKWEPDVTVLPGDTLVYIEIVDSFALGANSASNLSVRDERQKSLWLQLSIAIPDLLERLLAQFRQLSFLSQVRRVAIVCGLLVLMLLGIGTVLFYCCYPDTTWLSAFYATFVLLLGGYPDLLGSFEPIARISWWLQLFSLGLTVTGTAFVGVLYALLIEGLLSSKFQLIRRRPAVPEREHIIVVGLGRIGQQVAAFLQQLKQPLAIVTFKRDFEPTILPDLALVVGNSTESVTEANLATANSVVIVTDDEILNLEVALMAQHLNPSSHLIIRTSGQRLSQHLKGLLPEAQVLGADAVAAEVFAGAAFGENILNLFRLNHQTILVTEYRVEVGDTLEGLLLAEVAYGYGVVPILYQKPPNSSTFMPSDDLRLAPGERLVVLSSIEGLQRIERGDRYPQNWTIAVEKAATQESIFEGANTISRISGCSLSLARELMKNLPGVLNFPLYKPQARRAIGALKKVQAIAHLIDYSR